MDGRHGSDDTDYQGLAIAIQEKMKELPQYSERRCIYRIPNPLRQTKEQAYTPFLVSIGPLHHKDPRFLPMEAHKLKYLHSFLNDSQVSADLNSYLTIVKRNEANIRECYADPINLSSDDFTQMVLTDSAFIIQIFRRYSNPFEFEDDYMYRRPGVINEVLRDLELEENQLPFFILKNLYWTAFKPNDNSCVPYFMHIACKALNVNESKINVDASTNEANCLHLLDLLRCHYKPTTCVLSTDEDRVAINIYKSLVCPTATNLYKAGVKFQVLSNNDSSNLLDIHFDSDKAILTIPKICVMDSTEHLLRNMIAFEQCHYTPGHTYLTDYQSFMNWLIKSSEDVRLLARAGIIENWLGSDKEVCDIFSSLGQNVKLSVKTYSYLGITQQLVSHCNKRWNYYRAMLKHTYFAHPWAAISVFYAAILLILTLIQAVAGIKAIP